MTKSQLFAIIHVSHNKTHMPVNTINEPLTKEEIAERIGQPTGSKTGNNGSGHREGEVGTNPEALARIGAALNFGVVAVGGILEIPGQKLPGRAKVYGALNGEYDAIQGTSDSSARKIGHVGLGMSVAPPHSGGEL